jgi:hypothetical protein
MINELMKASTLGNVVQIKSLVAGGVDVETRDWRPIHMAAERGQPKGVRALAKLGADVNHTAKARCRCIGQRQWGMCRQSNVLVEAAADTEALITVNGMETRITALQLAVCQGKLGVIRVLTQCGANVDASTDDDDWNKAVHLTALNDQADVDGNWERICQPRLSRLEQVCNS